MAEHFKVYEVIPVPVSKTVTLQDGQFDPDPVDVTVGPLSYFANPAEKTVQGFTRAINDRDAHLTWYQFSQNTNEQDVTFDNQFGQQTWRLGPPQYLLVPAHKQEDDHNSPKGVDHYKAYVVVKVVQQVNPLPPVTLSDQFDRWFGGPQSYQQLMPAFFCVPVQKNNEGIIHREEDLAVYSIFPPGQHPHFPVRIWDQIVQTQVPLTVTESKYLCVPSRKVT